MRILMLAQFYPPIVGGEERHVRNLSMGLVRRGHDVCVATLQCPGTDALEIDGGVKIYRLPGIAQRIAPLFKDSERRHAPPFPDPELTVRLRQIVARERPDVVHAHNWILHSYLPLKKWTGAPLVVTLHDFGMVCAKKTLARANGLCSGPAIPRCLFCAGRHYGPLKGSIVTLANWTFGAIERWAADAFIAVSEAVASANRLQETGIPFEVIPNFVPDDVACLASPSERSQALLPKEQFIFFAGDLNRNKGVAVLLEAYRGLRDAPPLILVGRRCPETPANLPPGATIYSKWPHEAIMHAWSRCLFGVTPSVWPDPCPTVIMEAMASSKPSIATAIGGSPELIDHEKTGLIVRPDDAQALAYAMETLIRNPKLREAMGRAALEKVQTLSAAAIIPRIETLYKRLLARRGRSTQEAALQLDAGKTRGQTDGGPIVPVSIIVCAYTLKRWRQLCEALDSVRRQEPRAAEIILVSDYNTELERRAREAFPDIVVIANREKRGLSGARNSGIAVARQKYIAFLDDDAIAAKHWVANMLAECGKPGVAGVAPAVEPIWEERPPSWFPDEFLWVVGCSYRGLPKSRAEVRNILGCAFVVRRDLFERAGGFDHQLGRTGGKTLLSCEETEFCIRAKRAVEDAKFVFLPTADIQHKVPTHRSTWSYFTSRCYAEGISKAQVVQIAGAAQGLASERSYVLRTLSSGLFNALGDVVLGRDVSGLGRAAAIVWGLGCTSLGYMLGRLINRLRREPGPQQLTEPVEAAQRRTSGENRYLFQ
jgi:glycosyltransferase involved in cell wall biosynthesis/GT2 family glycosyltransferase